MKLGKNYSVLHFLSLLNLQFEFLFSFGNLHVNIYSFFIDILSSMIFSSIFILCILYAKPVLILRIQNFTKGREKRRVIPHYKKIILYETNV